MPSFPLSPISPSRAINAAGGASPIPSKRRGWAAGLRLADEESGAAGRSLWDAFDLTRFVEADGEGGRRKDGEGTLRWLASQVVGADSEFVTPFGRRRLTYCDHTASGRFLQVVENYLKKEVLPFYGNTHTVDSYVGLHTGELVRKASRYVKRCVGAGRHDVLLFCGTGSTAAIKRLQEVIGIALPPLLRPRVLDALDPSDRWVVFLGPYEHHSNLLSWRQSLAEVVEIGLDESGNIDIDALELALRSPEYAGRPKLGSFSACSNVTGVYTDTRAVARVLHEHGAFACFDFACSGPYVEIDMRSDEFDGYDAVFISPHKFLGGPGSPGILLMSDALYLLKGAPPSTSGGGTVDYVNGYSEKETIYCKDPEEREDAGTPAIVQKVRAALAFAVKNLVGVDLIHKREMMMARRALGRLARDPRIQVLGNNTGDRQPVISFIVYPGSTTTARGNKHLHSHFVSRLLNDLFGIQARGGCACAGPYGHCLLGVCRERSLAIRSAIEKGYLSVKPGFTRVSFAYYTPSEEMEFTLDAIKFVARYGHRFLALYDFEWRTGAWEFIGGLCKQRPLMSAARELSAKQYGGIDSVSKAAAYKKYMHLARSMAELLSEHVAERAPPEGLDPQLVTFMV